MTLFLIIWGVWSASKLPIDAVPDITNNQVQIITLCPTLAGQEVEQLVTFPIEQSIANLPDLEETRSISRFGLSVITVVFDDDVNIYFHFLFLDVKCIDTLRQDLYLRDLIRVCQYLEEFGRLLLLAVH